MVALSINQSIKQLTSQPTNQPINQSTNQPINQSINQSTNQPTNQASNQSVLFSPARGVCAALFLHLSPSCLAFVSCFPFVSYLSPSLVSHSGCSGPHDPTLVSHLCPSMLWVLWAAVFLHLSLACLALVSHLSPTCVPVPVFKCPMLHN